MVDISRIDIKEDYLQKKLNSLCHLFGWNLNDGVRVLFNGKESFLFYCNNIFVRYFISADMEMMYDIIQVDDEGKVVTFTLKIDDDDYQVVIDENGVKLIDENKNQRFLRLVKDNYSSDDISNNGVLGFGQYNIKNNILLEMRYEQMVHGSLDNKIIYADYIKEPYSYSFEYGLRINKLLSFIRRKKTFYRLDFDFRDNRWQYENSKRYHVGVLPKRAKYYKKVAFVNDEVGYTLTAMNEYGLLNVLKNGSYNLLREDRTVRYVKSLFIDFKGNYRDAWPFANLLKAEEIESLIKKYNFNTRIPDFIISLYNGENKDVLLIQEIVEKVRLLEKELLQPENSRMCLTLKFEEE